MEIVTNRLATRPVASVALTVNEYCPVDAGVPLMIPSAASASPGGM
jgi:hypothetical protein